MSVEPTIVPLDTKGNIYALQDERANIMGCGTREVCEVLLYLITKRAMPEVSPRSVPGPRSNVRAAIQI